jgi:hypothetical protein
MEAFKRFIKRALALLLLLAVMAGIGGYGGYYLYNRKNNPPPQPPPLFNPYAPEITFVSIDAEVDWEPQSLAELEEDSSLIVRGYILGNRQEVINYHPDSQTPRSGFTTSTLVVRECYKGTLLPGDKIPFVERYYTGSEGQMITYNHYMPVLPMEDYVFFLSRQPVDAAHFPGRYYLKCLTLGKYRALSQKQLKKGFANLSPETLGLSPDMNEQALAHYLSLFDQVAEGYIDPPTEEELAARALQEQKDAQSARTAADIPFWAIGLGFVMMTILGGTAMLLYRYRQNRSQATADPTEDAETDSRDSRLHEMLPDIGPPQGDPSPAYPDEDTPPEVRRLPFGLRLPAVLRPFKPRQRERT